MMWSILISYSYIVIMDGKAKLKESLLLIWHISKLTIMATGQLYLSSRSQVQLSHKEKLQLFFVGQLYLECTKFLLFTELISRVELKFKNLSKIDLIYSSLFHSALGSPD